MPDTYEIDRTLTDSIPWRLQVGLASLGGTALAFAASSLLRGSRFTLADITFDMLLACGFGFVGGRGMRRSPAVIKKRLKSLFEAAGEPDLVPITEVLADTGESDAFLEHRRLVDRFMRGMITHQEFYASFRRLVFGH